VLVGPVRHGEREVLARFHEDGRMEPLVPVRFVPLLRGEEE